MTLEETQIQLEQDSISKGAERYLNAVSREDSRGRTMETPVAERILRHYVRALVPVMLKLQVHAKELTDQTLTTGRRPAGWEWRAQLVSPEVLAYLAIKACVAAPYAKDARRIQSVALRIGQAVNNEVWWTEAKAEERTRSKATGDHNRIETLRWRVREIGPKTIRKWMKVLDDLSAEKWPNTECIRLGGVVFEYAAPHLEDILEIRNIKRGNRSEVKMVYLRETFLEQLMEAHNSVAMNRPWLQPMVVPPVDWTVEGGGEMTGGYLKLSVEGLKSGGQYNHTSVDGVPEDVLKAMNAVQRTPWAVNLQVLQVAEDAFKYDLGPTPYEAPKAMPQAIDDSEWEKMEPKERGRVRAARAEVYDHNFTQAERKQAQSRAMMVARDYSEYPAIYFPHSLDWRGRLYPIPQDLHPQATDFAKSLLKFAEGKPLGKRGFAWLGYHLANCYGMDKVSRAEQTQWVADNHERITTLAWNPWGDVTFWEKAEEPWQFLAAAVEYLEATLLTDPEEYVCALPISVDGSCNGLQHLSAMCLDATGGAAVNLTPGPRQDIYSIVADKVVDAIATEIDFAASGNHPPPNPEALLWCPPEGPKVTRKTVKRGVMTTPYGVTSRGLQEQLKGSKQVKEFGEQGHDKLKLAAYLRPLMQESIRSTVSKASETMEWMQGCADILSDYSEGISWVTPIGLRVTQEYRESRVQQVWTTMGRMRVGVRNLEGKIKKTKQRNSIAPNVIHSFDAAHMMLTVLSLEVDYGNISYAMVHDSFGCHACDVDKMLESTKANFVDIYRDNWFEALGADFLFFSKEAYIMPEPPEMGDLDISQVLESDYFFS